MTPTSVGMRCPECARQKQQVRTVRSGADAPVLTYILIGICVVVFIGGTASGASATGSGLGGSTLVTEGALSRSTVADGELWRLITAGFLHAGFFHLLFNMFSLYILGTMLEPAIGHARFALIYFVSLLAGSFGALLIESNPNALTVGASGAIFGLMSAAVIVMRNRGINPLESGLGLWIGLNLLLTFTIDNISIGGHIGGLIGGALAALVLFDLRDLVRVPAVAVNVICVGLGAAAVVGSVLVAS
jgi:membrane associated rhomboid family serine protease